MRVKRRGLLQGEEMRPRQGSLTCGPMALPKNIRTEHGGAKNSSAKSAWWGPRVEAKHFARKARRSLDRRAARETDRLH